MRPGNTAKVLLGAVVLTLLGAGPAGNSAVAPRHAVCETTGNVKVQTNDGGATWNWTISGRGPCVAPLSNFGVTFTGTGTSFTAGLCSGHLIVLGLDLTVHLTFVSDATGKTSKRVEHWVGPLEDLTTYPGVTPFKIQATPGLTKGAGAIIDRLPALVDQRKCPPKRAMDSATFIWAEEGAAAVAL